MTQGEGVGQQLVEIHDHFRNELTHLRDIVDQIRRGVVDIADARSQINAMAVRANTWAVGSMCLALCHGVTMHHTIETVSVFRHLRHADAGLTPSLDRLDSEHVAIHSLIEAVDAELVALVQRAEPDFAALDAAVELLESSLLSHFEFEESQLVGPLNRYGFG